MLWQTVLLPSLLQMVATNRPPQTVRDLAQQRVADRVAERVVHLLEPVDVQKEDGELREHEEHDDLGEGELPEVPLVAPTQRAEAHDEEEDQPENDRLF